MTRPYLEMAGCRQRQQRLLDVMRAGDLDAVVLRRKAHIQWLCGFRFGDHFDALAVLQRDGQVLLVAPHKEPPQAAADRVVAFPAKWHSTMRNDQAQVAAQTLHAELPELVRCKRVGVEWSASSLHVCRPLEGELLDIDPAMFDLRRCKDPDELACLRFAIAATGRMYEVAREMIRPGVREIDVFNSLQTAAVEFLDEPLTGTGNDYQVGSRGGPPRSNRVADAGELCILDLGPAYQGYFADNARTIAVSEVSADQQAAWNDLREIFTWIESTVRPGKSCRELFDEVQQRLDQASVGIFNHHLGHGIGLAPHEGPHLNPHWNDVFAVGDVFTAEPGLYDPQRLRAGIRLENDYLVTESGVELLSPFPLEL